MRFVAVGRNRSSCIRCIGALLALPNKLSYYELHKEEYADGLYDVLERRLVNVSIRE